MNILRWGSRTFLGCFVTGFLLLKVYAETLQLPPEISPWTWTTDVWSDGGYQDNLLLSRDAREASPFVRLGADLGLMRLPLGRFHFSAAVSAEEKRFTAGQTVDHERVVSANTEMSWDLGRFWQSTLNGQYLYQDQVIDASITDTNLSSLPVQGHTFELKPGLRRDISGGWWVEVGANLTRQTYQQADLDDYWEIGPRAQLGHRYGPRSEWSLELGVLERAYDQRETYTVDGNPIGGQPLSYRIPSLTFLVRQFWDQPRHWRTLTKFNLERNADNGSGYFNYDRFSLSQQLRYHTRTWELKGQARVARYQYDLQRADDGLQARQKDTLRALLRVERSLFSGLRIHAEYEYERALSNREIDGYAVNTFSAGLGWEF